MPRGTQDKLKKLPKSRKTPSSATCPAQVQADLRACPTRSIATSKKPTCSPPISPVARTGWSASQGQALQAIRRLSWLD